LDSGIQLTCGLRELRRQLPFLRGDPGMDRPLRRDPRAIGGARTMDATRTSAAIIQAADRLDDAFSNRIPVDPIRGLIGDSDIDAAYAVQRELIERRLAAGAVIVGRKIGLTSPAVQKQLGVDQPDFGVLFADMDVS